MSEASEERILLHESWNLHFEHAAGRAASRFLVALRDRQQLLASPCPACSRIFVPPRSFCEDCFVPTSDEWVEVGPEGVLESSTLVYAAFPGYDRDPPYAVAYVRPDGATTAIANYVSGLDLSNPDAAAAALEVGTRMRAVFEGERQAHISAFNWQPA
jgi:uncharacterized OB-fold protein